MQLSSSFSQRVNCVRFIAQHRSARTGSWTALEDTDTLVLKSGVEARDEADAKAICIRALKSKNRHSKYFRIVRIVHTHQTVLELEI